mmetsp:Transcript_121742/g.278971  ORF Transcript_121742/g.278971 Transcript_121742/m.278971 type:complete len:281 (-) Transcript_121742:564-1406(-)
MRRGPERAAGVAELAPARANHVVATRGPDDMGGALGARCGVAGEPTGGELLARACGVLLFPLLNFVTGGGIMRFSPTTKAKASPAATLDGLDDLRARQHPRHTGTASCVWAPGQILRRADKLIHLQLLVSLQRVPLQQPLHHGMRVGQRALWCAAHAAGDFTRSDQHLQMALDTAVANSVPALGDGHGGLVVEADHATGGRGRSAGRRCRRGGLRRLRSLQCGHRSHHTPAALHELSLRLPSSGPRRRCHLIHPLLQLAQRLLVRRDNPVYRLGPGALRL